MPIKIGKRKFEKFADAVAYVQKDKGMSKERAQAYVATIERKQRKKK